MNPLKEFILYLPVIALKGIGAWLVIGLILSFFNIDLLKDTTGYTHMHYYIIAVLVVGSFIHFIQKYYK
tara:strand:+ start:393 stop:599 length:207 start_codon:yes stop_codon:yes gene_type:complete